MPTINEIYKKYSTQYDQLVTSEDHKKNLKKFLLNNIDWNNKIVYEPGIGTGRLTKMYIDRINFVYGFDIENHMLEQCKKNLYKYMHKIRLNAADNIELPTVEEKADILIEGWSFGHTIVEYEVDVPGTTEKLIDNLNKLIKDNGIIVIIETLGTNIDKPKSINQPLDHFYSLIEKKYGFNKTIIRTDYMFNEYNEAADVLGFFFGKEMKEEILQKKINIIPEYTGIWLK